MSTRRGFLGALFCGTAATAGGVLLPKVAREKLEVAATPEMMKSLQEAKDGEIVVASAAMLPDEFFETRVNLYRAWWRAASQKMWTMDEVQFENFIQAHLAVNKRFGIVPPDEKGAWVEADVGMKTPYGDDVKMEYDNEWYLSEDDKHLRRPLGNADRESPIPLKPGDKYV